jgi:NTP pyrophosphatase (non-canonical NTP hydrolase)
MNIRDLQKKCHKIAVDHGFWGKDPIFANLGEKIALIHSELSELLEVYRYGVGRSSHYLEGLTDLDSEEEEFADIVIRIMDLAEARNVDLGRCIAVKSEFNKNREKMHGKKF